MTTATPKFVDLELVPCDDAPVWAPAPKFYDAVVPRAWIGCMACYNAGRLVGDWFDAETADQVTLADVHKPGRPRRDCEELWVYDHEFIPERGEMDPLRAAQWGRRIAEVDEHMQAGLLAWVRSGSHVVDAEDLPILEEFVDRYCGEYDSWEDFAHHELMQSGMLDDVPEIVARYFCEERWARDLRFDYDVEDAPSEGVYVFRSL